MKRSLHSVILLAALLSALAIHAQQLIPPRNVHVDDLSLVASWDAPRMTLLAEDFEGNLFPPAGWQMHTHNPTGWFTSVDGNSPYFPIPAHTKYALTNDDAAGPGMDACCDYLITPAVDLSICPGFKLSFDSYFNGNHEEKATVEMSTDNGVSWILLREMTHYPNWKSIIIDLSPWSGLGGLSSVMFAFHANDQGGQASGWAVDNVRVQSDSTGSTGYTVLFNHNPLAVLTGTSYPIDPFSAAYGNAFTFCVKANYPAASSADSCVSFTSLYLSAPGNLTAAASDTGLLFTWQAPLAATTLSGYNIYQDGILITSLAANFTSFVLPLEFGQGCIEITAVHNLASFGFPGQSGESFKQRACGFVDTGFDLPFLETWTSGSLLPDKWVGGNNWSVSVLEGKDAPSAKFEGSGSGSYSSALESWHFNSQGFDDCPTIVGARMNFSLKLNDVKSSGKEQLIVELVTDSAIIELKRYRNEGSFDWKQQDLDITMAVLDQDFRVRFRAEGENGGNIDAWYIDNINLYKYISDSWGNLSVTAKRQGSPENEILIAWNNNSNGIAEPNYILDDGIPENWLSGMAPGPLWKGNKFTVSDEGILQGASVLCSDIPGTSAIYTIDIFDENGVLHGSSASFIPLNNIFTTVPLPDIPFSGTFYAMLHITAAESANPLGIDTDGPNASGDYSWVYNGISWEKLFDYSSITGVFAIRISAMVGTIIPGTGNPCDVFGYNIYRREYGSYPAGPNNTGTGVFNWIGSAPFGTNEFVDRDLDNNLKNCFEYEVRQQFAQGEGMSDYAWDCIYVDVKEPEKVSVQVYPNPAEDILTIKMSIPVEHITVYNATGGVVAEIHTQGRSAIELNVTAFSKGIYSLKLNTARGESFCAKFMKQ